MHPEIPHTKHPASPLSQKRVSLPCFSTAPPRKDRIPQTIKHRDADTEHRFPPYKLPGICFPPHTSSQRAGQKREYIREDTEKRRLLPPRYRQQTPETGSLCFPRTGCLSPPSGKCFRLRTASEHILTNPRHPRLIVSIFISCPLYDLKIILA